MNVEITWTEELEHKATIRVDEAEYLAWLGPEDPSPESLADFLRAGEYEDWIIPGSDDPRKRTEFVDATLHAARAVES